MGADLMEVGAVEWWPLERIVPYARNAKVHGEAQVAQLAGMIREFGWTYPILVDEEGVILAGHKRLLACERLGLESAPVLVKRGLDKHQKQAYRLADNKLTENSAWDEGLLKIEIDELRDAGVDLGLTAFSGEELKTLWGVEDEPAADPGPQVDRAEELREKWGVERGQLWQLGEHRLICGDCTDKATVERVMGGERAQCMWTDPPYGVSYVGKTKDSLTIANDGAEGLPDLLSRFLTVANSILDPGAAFYIAHPPGALCLVFGNAIVSAGWKIHQTLTWLKDSMVLGHSDYHYIHEPIYYGWTQGRGRPGRGNHEGSRWFGDHSQVSVFQIPRPKVSADHPTGKPVELVAIGVRNSSKSGEIVYEPFSGSGTTLIACEQLGRRCRAVEIAPAYVAVALQRWADMVGLKPKLMGSGG